MRKIDVSHIGSSVGMPVKSGTLVHLQLAYQEALNALAQSQIGSNYDSSKVYILYGCVNSGSGSTFTISAGAVFYNGEVYLVDAVSFTASGTAVGTIGTTYFGTNADPVTFTDSSTANVHQIRKMVIADATSGSGVADYTDWVLPTEWIEVTGVTGVTFTGCTASVTNAHMTSYKNGNSCFLNFYIVVNVVSGSSFNMLCDLPISTTAVVGGEFIAPACIGFFNKTGFCTAICDGGSHQSKLQVAYNASPGTGSLTLCGQITYPLS
jgi:hypothetical protein